MSISERIKSLRVSKNYSQEYMATQLNISQRAYSKLENSEIKMDMDKLNKIAEVFEMDPAELISNDSNQTNNFHNYKTITNAVVNHYVKSQDAFQMEIVKLLKDEIFSLRSQIQHKDEIIRDLVSKIK